MYINFQQIWVSRSVKTVHTNILANNRKLHKFATTNSTIEIDDYFRHASSYNVHHGTCILIFSIFVLVDQSKLCTQIYLQIIASGINLQLPIVTLKKLIISNMHCYTLR